MWATSLSNIGKPSRARFEKNIRIVDYRFFTFLQAQNNVDFSLLLSEKMLPL